MKTRKPDPEAIVKKVIKIRTNGTKDVGTEIIGPSLTQQQFKDEADVNKIMEKYSKTGTITHIRNTQAGVYADLTNLPSYQEALDTVIKAESAFMEIPAEIRLRFNNDPQELIAFLSDPAKDEEAVKLGLKVKVTKPKDEITTPAPEQVTESVKPT